MSGNGVSRIARAALILAVGTACASDDVVRADPDPVMSVLIRGRDSLLVGDTARFTATALNRNFVVIEGRAIEWKTTDTMIARVDATGLVKATGSGMAGIVASTGTVADTFEFRGRLSFVTSLAPLEALTIGHVHACALTGDGEAHCWGENTQDQLGRTISPFYEPGAVETDQRFSRIDAGRHSTCALSLSGEMYCWGQNRRHAIAPDTTHDAYISRPRAIPTNERFADLTHSNEYQTCGITDSGEAWCWGNNLLYQLGRLPRNGRDSSVARSAEAHQWRMISAGGHSTCGIDTGLKLWCWGSPVLSSADTSTPIPQAVGDGPFVALDAGYFNACAVTDTGAGYCWGAESAGLFPDGVGSSTPRLVGDSLRWQQLVVGSSTVCGVTIDGALYCWGSERGFRDIDVRRPQRVMRDATFTSVAIEGAYMDTACAIRTGGLEVYCF